EIKTRKHRNGQPSSLTVASLSNCRNDGARTAIFMRQPVHEITIIVGRSDEPRESKTGPVKNLSTGPGGGKFAAHGPAQAVAALRRDNSAGTRAYHGPAGECG